MGDGFREVDLLSPPVREAFQRLYAVGLVASKRVVDRIAVSCLYVMGGI
jgi:hypothetical protein